MQATETFALGGTQVTTVVEIDLTSVWLISGDFSGTIPSGQTGFINGNVNLTGDLIVEGFLTGIDTFTLEGNGFQILAQDGGQINLQGVEKSAWIRWGDTPTGWQTGDRVAVAPTAPNVFVPSEVLWGAARPVNSPDVTLPDGSIARPEVANLTQTITLKNLRRIHFHDDAGVQTLKWLRILNSGITGVLSEYPLHFHHCGESVRGSLVEGVVVEGGKNHAFVPHDSHGVTFRGCVAFNTTGDAYWWDPPIAIPPQPIKNHTANNSNDTLYDRCLGLWVKGTDNRLTAMTLGAGAGNAVKNSAMSCVQGGADAAGFNWPESANGNIGGNRWVYENNVSHNNKSDGVFVWQNDASPHFVDGLVSYRNGQCQIEHGAYENHYHYKDLVLMGGTVASLKLHAHGRLIFENISADGQLRVTTHNASANQFAIVRNATFTSVIYVETTNNGFRPSKIRYEDCGLAPADFDLSGIVATSLIEIVEAGSLAHRWANGAWT